MTDDNAQTILSYLYKCTRGVAQILSFYTAFVNGLQKILIHLPVLLSARLYNMDPLGNVISAKVSMVAVECKLATAE